MHREWPGVIGPAGVVEQGIGTMGVPRESGLNTTKAGVGRNRFHLRIGPGRCPTETAWPPVGVGPCGRHKDRRKRWYRQAKETLNTTKAGV